MTFLSDRTSQMYAHERWEKSFFGSGKWITFKLTNTKNRVVFGTTPKKGFEPIDSL
jgi:hypothetical protein